MTTGHSLCTIARNDQSDQSDHSDHGGRVPRVDRRGHWLLAAVVALAAGLWLSPAQGQKHAGDVGDIGGASDTAKVVVALEAAATQAAARGDTDAAMQARGRALQLARELGRPALSAALLHRLGQLQLASGRVQDAVLSFEAGVVALADRRQPDIERLVGRLGAVAKGLPRRELPVPMALYNADVERDLAADEHDEALVLRLLLGVGNGYLQQLQDGPALNAYERALERPQTARRPLLRAQLLANRGEALRRQGQLALAEASLNEALAGFEQAAPRIDQRRALTLLAGIHRDRREDTQALRLYQQALLLHQQAGDSRGEASTRTGLGHLLARQGRHREAAAQYEQAVGLASRLGVGSRLWPAYLGLGRAERALGRLDAAALALAASVDALQAAQDDLRTDEGKVGLLESAQDLQDELLKVELQRAPGRPEVYARLLELTEAARGKALTALIGGWGARRPQAASFGLPECVDPAAPGRPGGQGRAEESAQQVFIGRPQEQRASSVASPRGLAPTAPALGASAASNTAAVSNLSALPNVAAFPNASALPNSSAFANAAAFPNARAFPPGTRNAPRAASIQLAPALTRLVYYVFDDATLVLVAGADGRVHGHVAPLGRERLAREVALLRRALVPGGEARGLRGTVEDGLLVAGDDRRGWATLSRGLYEALVAPVQAWLPAPGGTVVIEPHDALWLLPYAALDAGGSDWMGARWSLLYAPSAELLAASRNSPALARERGVSGLIIGNPIVKEIEPGQAELFRLGFAPLPGAEEESRRIAAMFAPPHARLLRGAEADLSTVVREAGEVDVLHLASHGVVSGDEPLKSFVLLAPSPCGERLTAQRVMTLALKADLVALSACQTGLGRIASEGVLGLSRAFLFAGARTVLVSHWSVSDQATTALMTGFYERYLGMGLDKAQALRESMRSLRAQPGFDHPRYWAPFFLVGAE
ncbi:MAG: hypothetical protein RIQ60_3774 [Pseudomonadota bacterium]|jgi:tetratricopeptide (TPR) repeat protein